MTRIPTPPLFPRLVQLRSSSTSLKELGEVTAPDSRIHARRPSDGGPAPPQFIAGADEPLSSIPAHLDAPGGLRSIISIDDLQNLERLQDAAGGVDEVVMRLGIIAAFTSMEDLESQVNWLKNMFESTSPEAEPINVLNIVLRLDPASCDHNDDDKLMNLLSDFISRHRDDFYSVQIRRVTFIMTKKATFPKYFTFRERLGFTEDAIYRHVDPALAFKLEMFRLANYDVRHCPTRNPHLHLYFATAAGENRGREGEERGEEDGGGRRGGKEAFFV